MIKLMVICSLVVILILLLQFGVFNMFTSPYKLIEERRGINNFQSQEELETFLTEWTDYIIQNDCYWTGTLIMDGFAEISWLEKKKTWLDFW